MADFREITRDDTEAVLAMMAAYHTEDGLEFDALVSRRGLEMIAAGTPLALLWLIEEGGKSVGYLCVTAGFSLEVGGGDFFLDEIYVVPDARGRGLGSQALDFAEGAARDFGARRICLEVTRQNKRARKLYADIGFEEHDRHLMSKPLSGD